MITHIAPEISQNSWKFRLPLIPALIGHNNSAPSSDWSEMISALNVRYSLFREHNHYKLTMLTMFSGMTVGHEGRA